MKFHADGCGSCQAMGDVFTDLENKFDGRPVLFVTVDRTNRTPCHRSAMLAGALGLDTVYNANGGTGFILLLDANTKPKATRHRVRKAIRRRATDTKAHDV